MKIPCNALLISMLILSISACEKNGKKEVEKKESQDGVTAISGRGFQVLILKANNMLWATGSNSYGQLGNDTLASLITPKQIMGDLKMISAGGYLSLILKIDNTLWTTSSNSYR